MEESGRESEYREAAEWLLRGAMGDGDWSLHLMMHEITWAAQKETRARRRK